MRLSKRLQQIETMVAPGYTHVWDCCCDHGLLGAALLSRQAAPNLHFVDVVPALMDELEYKLQRFFPASPSIWKTHCLDVAALPLESYAGKHLIIIAGVGGDLMARMVANIHRNFPIVPLDFLLCPVRGQFALRQQLMGLDFSLIDEVLLEDNRQFYEILLVSLGSALQRPKVGAVGESIWQVGNEEQSEMARVYLSKTLKHYRRMQRRNSVDVQDIIEAYRKVMIRC